MGAAGEAEVKTTGEFIIDDNGKIKVCGDCCFDNISSSDFCTRCTAINPKFVQVVVNTESTCTGGSCVNDGAESANIPSGTSITGTYYLEQFVGACPSPTITANCCWYYTEATAGEYDYTNYETSADCTTGGVAIEPPYLTLQFQRNVSNQYHLRIRSASGTDIGDDTQNIELYEGNDAHGGAECCRDTPAVFGTAENNADECTWTSASTRLRMGQGVTATATMLLDC